MDIFYGQVFNFAPNYPFLLMKKFFLFLLLFLLFSQPLCARDQLWFIPGWLSSSDTYEPHKEQLSQIYTNCDITVRYWRSSRLWHIAVKNADAFALQLAEEISRSPAPEKLILVGHSLGGFIISRLAPVLMEKKLRVKAIVYLGAAVDVQNRGFFASTQISREPVINLFSYGDGVLKYLYVNAERNWPLGLIGTPERLPNLYQYHVTTGVNADLRQSYEELFNHLASKYLDALMVIKTKPATSEFYVDFNALETIAAKNSATVKKISVPQFKQLNTIKEYGGWRLSSFTVSAKFIRYTVWLLISPIGSHYLFFNHRQAEENFKSLRRILAKQLP